jgi:hypothetical protein
MPSFLVRHWLQAGTDVKLDDEIAIKLKHIRHSPLILEYKAIVYKSLRDKIGILYMC